MQVSLGRILGNPNHVRLLRLLRSKAPLRFNQIQEHLGIGPAEVNRAINLLKQDLWILPQTVPTKGDRIFVEWALSKRGQALVEAWESLHEAVRDGRRALGDEVVQDFEAVYA